MAMTMRRIDAEPSRLISADGNDDEKNKRLSEWDRHVRCFTNPLCKVFERKLSPGELEARAANHLRTV